MDLLTMKMIEIYFIIVMSLIPYAIIYLFIDIILLIDLNNRDRRKIYLYCLYFTISYFYIYLNIENNKYYNTFNGSNFSYSIEF